MRRSVALSLVLLAGLPACGGDDRLSEEEFRRQAAGICQAAERDVQALGSPAGTTADAVADYFRRALAVAERRVDQQQALRAPESLEDEQRRVVAIQREGVEVVRELVRDLERGRDPREVLIQVQERLQRLETRSDELARRLGLDACTSDAG